MVYFLIFAGNEAVPRRFVPLKTLHDWSAGLLRLSRICGRWSKGIALCWLSLLLAVNAFDAPRLIRTAKDFSPEAVQRTQLLVDEMSRQIQSKDLEKLRAMNDFFNHTVAYEDDQIIWARMDYWTSPIELLNKGMGDCEDFALAKYFSLISLGIAPSKLRMVYVRANVGGAVLAHMVLAYYAQPNADPLILDNLNGEVLPASRRGDLAPVFSFNAQGLWQGVGATSAGDPVARLSKWRDVLTRSKAEGWW